MRVLVKGAGVAGLAVALELVRQGHEVEVAERKGSVGHGASWFAGGMLAPWCESECASEAVLAKGLLAADWWEQALPGTVTKHGTLVVAQPRDAGELTRFAARTSGYEWVDEGDIAALEPALAGRFRKGLYFKGEAHLDPRAAVMGLYNTLKNQGVTFLFNVAGFPVSGFDDVIDCTGATAIGDLDQLRGVRGEMLYLQTSEINLSRPVRLLHPRFPLYVVPRDHGRFMVGATMIESNDYGPVTARSLMELISAAYALHPAFGEAKVIELGAGVRPAFPDNFPQSQWRGDTLHINGMYRHGFLLAPALAQQAAVMILNRLRSAAQCA